MISLLFKEIHPYGNNRLAEFIYFILPQGMLNGLGLFFLSSPFYLSYF